MMNKRIVPVIWLIYNIATMSFEKRYRKLNEVRNFTGEPWWTPQHVIQEEYKIC